MVQQAGEPTVEEILESIRKVVAGDSRRGAPGGRSADVDDEVLELTEIAEHAADRSRTEDEAAPLLAADRHAAMRDSLSALAALAEPAAASQIVRSAQGSVDRITRELLRPMLAEWLDRNLPPLVEKMVAAEIARIAGKGV